MTHNTNPPRGATPHTPEPWSIYDPGADTEPIITYWHEGEERTEDICVVACGDRDENQANAARIVACVNACAGLNPAAIADAVKALEAFVNGWEGNLTDAVGQARAALQALKGGE